MKEQLRPYYKALKSTKTYRRAQLRWTYTWSYFGPAGRDEPFHGIGSVCLFIGHGMSGHSVIGALLDAHPDIVLPDEVDAMGYILKDFSKQQIYRIMLKTSQRQARAGKSKRGRRGNPYCYAVPGQWQGRFDELKVIGASKAGVSTRHLERNPGLLPRVQGFFGVPVKFIQVVRNPFDNISTMNLKLGKDLTYFTGVYLSCCKALAEARRQLDESNLLTIRQEDFINDPESSLARMCGYLGLEAPSDYLESCAKIIYKSPVKSRHEVKWDPDRIASLQREIDAYDFLDGYSFDC